MSPFDTPKRFAVILGALLVSAFAWGTSDAFAQEEASLSIETQRAPSGEAVDVPVQASGFNDVGAVSLTVTYDPDVTSFPDGDLSTGDLISGAPRSGFEASRPEPGELRITWFDQGSNPIDFGEGRLLDITFSNFAGGAGNVVFDEANSEVSDAQGDPVAVAFGNGSVIDQDAGTVSAGTVADASLNETVSVPLSGQDVGDVGSASLEIGYDTSVLQFEGIANDQSGLGLTANASGGVVRIAGQNVSGGSLGDSFVEVEFSFLGGVSDLNFLVDSEVTDLQGTVLPTEFADGNVTGDTPLVSFPDRGVDAGETISVPVQAEDLQDVGAVTLEATYDPSVLTFEGSEDGFDVLSTSNPSDGVVRISGQDPSGIDPATNDDKFVNLRFSVGQGLGLGTENTLDFNADESELANTDAEPYNTAFESGLVRVEETEIAVSPDSVAYDVTAIDSTSNRTVTITNESDSVATLEGEVSGTDAPFAIASGGGSFTLAPGESRDVTVDYAPTEVSNPDRDTLQITHNADNEASPTLVPLSGEAEAPQIAAQVVPSDTTVRSGRSVTLTQTVSNEATDAAVLEAQVTGVPSFLALESSEVTGGGSFNADSLELSLDPGAEATLTYSFEEEVDSTTTFEGAIAHQTNDPANPTVDLPVSITSQAAQIALVPDSLGFGPTAIEGARGGDAAPTGTFDIENPNGAVLTVDSVTVAGDDSPFAVTGAPDTPFEVEPDSSREIAVTYDPAESGDDAGTVVIGSDADNVEGSVEVGLSGTAEAPSISAQVVPSDTTVRSGRSVTLTQTVSNEATDAAVLEAQVTGVPSFLALESSEVTGGGSFNADSLELSLDPGAEATLTYSFEEEVDSTTTFEGAIAHQTNDPANPTVDLPVSIAVDPVQVALPPQALDRTTGDTELRATDIIANSGDVIVVTTDNGDGTFDDETVVGSTELTEDLDGGEVLVDVLSNDPQAEPTDHAAHVSTDGTVSGVVATSETAPVYAVSQFDWQDETAVGETGTVTVDAIEVLYDGDVGADTLSIDLHEVSGGAPGAFVGVSQEDLAVGEVHEDVTIDVVEPVAPGDDTPERIEDVIDQTGDFFAMAHLGAAGTDANGNRIPAQRPALATTTEPGTVGDFATVEVDLQADITRTFDDPSDPTNYEIIALPGDVDVDAAASLNGTQGPDWRVLREDGGDGNLVNYDGSDAFRFDEGRAFWVIAKNNFSFQDTVGATDVSSVALQEGWNAVSNPLRQDRAWSAIQDANGLDEALWRWTDSGNWEQVDTLASAQSGEGFYVLNSAGLDSLSLTGGAAGQSLAAEQPEGKEKSGPRAVELTARLQDGVETSVSVGVGEETSVYHAPPAHFGSNAALRVLDSEGDEEYARMIAKSGGGEATKFDLVLRGEENGGATLETSGLDSEDDQGAVLVVEETGDRYDLGEHSSITVPTGESGEARLSLHMGTQEQVQEVATPDETKLRGNYPNPFSDRTTLELSISEPTDVKIQVYNVLGQRVATVADKNMDAGTHQLTWADGSLASGTYFVRMEAGDARDVHKITVVR